MYTLIVVFSLPLSCFASENTTTDFPEKPILRYGFQYTYDCPMFEKAFICIQKCQDLNYDSATSDKHCICTCHMKGEMHKYKNKLNTTRDVWKKGAPTTKLPVWAQTTAKENNEMDDDPSENKDVSGKSEREDVHTSEDHGNRTQVVKEKKKLKHNFGTVSSNSTVFPEPTSMEDETSSSNHKHTDANATPSHEPIVSSPTDEHTSTGETPSHGPTDSSPTDKLTGETPSHGPTDSSPTYKQTGETPLHEPTDSSPTAVDTPTTPDPETKDTDSPGSSTPEPSTDATSNATPTTPHPETKDTDFPGSSTPEPSTDATSNATPTTPHPETKDTDSPGSPTPDPSTNAA